MIVLPLLAQLAVADMSGDAASRFEACVALTRSDPRRAAAEADSWRLKGGGIPAGQCLGLAFVAQERWVPATAAFEQAARSAEIDRDGRAATLLVQAANAALAGDDAAHARALLDRALLLPVLVGQMRGEAFLDRARAGAALRDYPAVRADLDKAAALVPQDPLLWLLSATLARRQNDLPRAGKDIAEALRLSPDDASVAYEAGNIAAVSGQAEAATLAWKQAVKLDADSAAGRAAAGLLTQAGEGKPSLAYDALDDR